MTIREITVDELAALDLAAIALVDVREPDEAQEARVPETLLVPLATVPDRVDEIRGLPAGPVYVICAAGGRSMQACEFLAAQGIDAINIAGGTKGWVAAGHDYQTGPLG